jgi:hypothetical protein
MVNPVEVYLAVLFLIVVPISILVLSYFSNKEEKECEEPTTKPTEETITRRRAKLSDAFGEQPSTPISSQYQPTISRREMYTRIANGTNTEDLKIWVQAELNKLDQEVYSKTTASIKRENQPIADAIVTILSQGKMLSTDLAVAIGQSVVKTNGIASQMEKLGILTKSKVKVKGKGQVSCYELRAD